MHKINSTEFTLKSIQNYTKLLPVPLERLNSSATIENYKKRLRKQIINTTTSLINWLSNGKPGGHKSILSSVDNKDLSMAYESSLQMLNATDTLVAVVTKG